MFKMFVFLLVTDTLLFTFMQCCWMRIKVQYATDYEMTFCSMIPFPISLDCCFYMISDLKDDNKKIFHRTIELFFDWV